VKLVWSQRARQDLAAIARFIAADNPSASRAHIARLRENARSAADLPLSGRVVPEVGSEALRERIVGRYRLVYQVAEQGIRVVMVFEGHRQMPDEVEPGSEGPPAL